MKSIWFVVGMGVLALGFATAAVSSSIQDGWHGEHDGAARVSETAEYVFPWDGQAALALHNHAGRIHVSAWARPEIAVTAVKRAEDQEGVNAMRIDIAEAAGDLRIRSEPQNGRDLRGVIDYTLRVPAGLRLRVEQGAGEVRLTGTDGLHKLSVAAGELYLGDLTGADLEIELGAGELHLSGVRLRSLAVEVGAGEVTLDAVEAGSVRAELGAGDLSVRLSPAASIAVRAQVGIGEVALGPAPWAEVTRQGFLAQTVRASLGAARDVFDLNVGLGRIALSSVQSGSDAF